MRLIRHRDGGNRRRRRARHPCLGARGRPTRSGGSAPARGCGSRTSAPGPACTLDRAGSASRRGDRRRHARPGGDGQDPPWLRQLPGPLRRPVRAGPGRALAPPARRGRCRSSPRPTGGGRRASRAGRLADGARPPWSRAVAGTPLGRHHVAGHHHRRSPSPSPRPTRQRAAVRPRRPGRRARHRRHARRVRAAAPPPPATGGSAPRSGSGPRRRRRPGRRASAWPGSSSSQSSRSWLRGHRPHPRHHHRDVRRRPPPGDVRPDQRPPSRCNGLRPHVDNADRGDPRRSGVASFTVEATAVGGPSWVQVTEAGQTAPLVQRHPGRRPVQELPGPSTRSRRGGVVRRPRLRLHRRARTSASTSPGRAVHHDLQRGARTGSATTGRRGLLGARRRRPPRRRTGPRRGS